MHEDRLTSLYARLQAERPAVAARTAPYRLARALREDAEALSRGIAGLRSPQPRRRVAPAWGWAVAAAVALAAVFASGRLGQAPMDPAGLPAPQGQDLVASGPAAEPLFSGSFERGERRGAESIFDSDFGS